MNKFALLILLVLFIGALFYANVQVQKKSAAGADFLITMDKMDAVERSLIKMPIIRKAIDKAEASATYASLRLEKLLADLHLNKTSIKQYPALEALVTICDPGEKKIFTAPDALILACSSQLVTTTQTLIDRLGYQLSAAARGAIFLKNQGSDVYKNKKSDLCKKTRLFVKQYVSNEDFPSTLATFYFSECHEKGDAVIFSKNIDQQFLGCIKNEDGDDEYAIKRNKCVEHVIETTDFSKIPVILN